MTLIKTSILSGIATLTKVFTSFFLNKIIAVYVGPAGLAYIGQFQNFIQFITSFATGAIDQGIVKYTAEYKDDIDAKSRFWSAAFKISLVCSVTVALFMFIFSKWLSLLFFKTDIFNSIFLVLACTLVFFALNNQMIAILNGQGEIKKLTAVNISSSLITLLLMGTLSYYYGVYGALLSIAIGPTFVFIIAISFVIKSNWFNRKYFYNSFEKGTALKLGKFALMAITTAVTAPVSQILIRNYIGINLSWEYAGYWEGVSRISSIYLMLVTTTLSVYYLPKLSGLHNPEEIWSEIIRGYKYILPLTITGAAFIYIARSLLIDLLFTDNFSPMSGLFAFQLVGDVFKISSWLIAYIMVAKAMIKVFIVTEVIFSLNYVMMSIFFIKYSGIVGVTYSYCLNYLFYLIFLIINVKKIVGIKHLKNWSIK